MSSPETGDTATVPLAARCDGMADNALRVGCSVVLATPGPVRVELDRSGGPLRIFPSPEVTTKHDVPRVGAPPVDGLHLAGDSDEVGGEVVEGELTTGPPPD